MSSFKETHPWINFRPNLQTVPFTLWIMLGEAAAKCRYIAGVPLKPTIAVHLQQLYLAKGVVATTAIEGNTLREDQVIDLLQNRLRLPPSQDYLQQEANNVIQACNEILKELQTGLHPQVDLDDIKRYNYQILQGLSLAEEVTAGEIRHHSVVVGSYLPPKADECIKLMQEFCKWYNELPAAFPSDIDKIVVAILRAVLAHIYFVWIHPFGDGNGRTARLIEVRTLIADGVPSPAAHLLSNHYNLTRTAYYRNLDLASQKGDSMDFLVYAVRGFLDQLDEQIAVIREQQLRIAWKDYVYEMFSDKESKADTRRRQLVLDLSSEARSPITKNKIANLTPDLAREYADKTLKTLSRDLNVVTEMNLVQKTQKGYIANTQTILAFLPMSQSHPLVIGE